jgi:histidyl-tRNA synthetase
VRDVFRAYNFQEIRTPIFEATELFARGVGEETDIVSKEMFTWEDGERFNEKKMIDEWVTGNESSDRSHVQLERVNVNPNPPFQVEGVQLHVTRGLGDPSRPWAGAVGSCEEFVAFAPRISPDAIAALKKALTIARSQYANQFSGHQILPRLVVPDAATKNYSSLDTEGIEVEGFAGNFFSSSQSLTLRPEGTAGIVRAYIEHNLETRGLNKLFCIGPMFRRERPQKGRYRQFYQIDAEVIGPASAGSDSPARDAEVLEMLAALLDRLGIKGWTLELNSVGSASDRARFNVALRAALVPVVDQMCSDCKRRAETNPLRVFDCKVPEDQPIIEKLPRISQFLDNDSRQHFEAVQEILTRVGVPFTLHDRLVRGLDYYTRTAFEFTHGALGAQNAILGGGRYDGLSEALGGPAAPGIGFAIGEDRLVMSLQEATPAESVIKRPDVYIAALGAGMNGEAARLARELRRHDLVVDLGDETFRLKKSFEGATKAGAKYILIVGENEVNADAFALKNLATGEQVSVPRGELARKIQER